MQHIHQPVVQSLLVQMGKPELGVSFSAKTNCPMVGMEHSTLSVQLHLMAPNNSHGSNGMELFGMVALTHPQLSSI